MYWLRREELIRQGAEWRFGLSEACYIKHATEIRSDNDVNST